MRPRRSRGDGWHWRWTVFGVGAALAAGLCQGCSTPGGGRAAPVWVTDPAAAEATYPRSRYLLGFGACGGAGERDVMGRRQAENNAIADIVATVEVSINDVVEQYDTTVARDDRETVQSVRHQHTRREATGLLSGIEIRGVYFDPRAYTWHAMAVLDRRRARQGALEAVNRRLTDGRTAVAACGARPLRDLLDLLALETTVVDLERLRVAVALFAPSQQTSVASRVEAFKQAWSARLQAARRGVSIQVRMAGDAAPAPDLTAAVAACLEQAGLPVGSRVSGQVFEIALLEDVRTQHGSVRLQEIRTGASFRLADHDGELLSGRCEPGPETAARARDAETARRHSLKKLAPVLEKRVASVLARKTGRSE